MELQVGDYCRCDIPIKKPGRWGRRVISCNATVVGITGQYVQVRTASRKDKTIIHRSAIERFWRSENGKLIRSTDA